MKKGSLLPAMRLGIGRIKINRDVLTFLDLEFLGIDGDHLPVQGPYFGALHAVFETR